MPASSNAFHVASGRRRNRVASLDPSRSAAARPTAFSTIDLVADPFSIACDGPRASVSVRSIDYPPTNCGLGSTGRATLRKFERNFDDHVFLTADSFASADLGQDFARIDAEFFRRAFSMPKEAGIDPAVAERQRGTIDFRGLL